jgi:hypothetical protein
VKKKLREQNQNFSLFDVAAKKMHFCAARQFDFVSDAGSVLCSVRCCTDFVARKEKLRFGGGAGNKIPKTVHNNGYVWSVECEMY